MEAKIAHANQIADDHLQQQRNQFLQRENNAKRKRKEMEYQFE